VVPTINRLAHGVREAGGRVVWVISTYGPDAADYWPVLFEHVMGPDVAAAFRAGLTKGAEGHAIWCGLEVGPDEPIVDKNRFSGFIGSNGRLERLLRQGGIDTVLVTGTVTNVCCESTAREAAMLNFKTIMVSDGNGGRSTEEDLETYSVFLKAFGDVMTCDGVLERLARAPSPHAKETV
jgi:ureidoacrylate peracid hydrolase